MARPTTQPAAQLHERGPSFSQMHRCMAVQDRSRSRRWLAQFLGFSPLAPGAVPWFRSALGEVEVATLLAELGDDWTVLHSVPIGSGHADIDHSLIGPAGVITISERAPASSRVWVSGDTLSIAGIPVDHIRNAEYEAQRARTALARIVGKPIPVTPVLVLLGVDHIMRGNRATTVDVIRPSDLRGWLSELPVVLNSTDVEALAAVSIERALWHSSSRAPGDTADLERRFGQLCAEVRAARVRSRRVALALTGVLLAVAAIAIQYSTAIGVSINAH
jgi:hypothetical protein